jgi:hypothetical protein
MDKTVTKQQLRKYSITTGVVFAEKYLQAAFSNDAEVARDPETRHAYLGVFKGRDWILIDFNWPIRSQTVVTKPQECIISISDTGSVRRSTPSGGMDESKIGDASGEKVLGRSRMVEVRNIDGCAYSVGTRRSVYRRSAENRWDCIDAGCYSPKDSKSGFQSIHGFSSKEIYAVGRRGEIWEFNGNVWIERDSGTNVTLHKVLCAPDGFVYAAGKNGAIVKGRHDAWQPLADIPAGYEFWGMQDYAGRIFLTANTSLVLELLPTGALQLVDFGDCDIPATAYHLTVGAGCLYSFGAKHIRKFDGREWEDVLTLE